MKRIVIVSALICLSIISFGFEMPDRVGHDEASNVRPGPDRASQPDSTRCHPDESIAFAQYDTLALEMDL